MGLSVGSSRRSHSEVAVGEDQRARRLGGFAVSIIISVQFNSRSASVRFTKPTRSTIAILMARSSCRVAFVVWQQLQKRWKSTYWFLRLQSSRLPAQSLIFGCQHWQTQGQSRAVNDVRKNYAFTIKISDARPSGPLRLNTAANDLILGPM